MTLAVEIPGRLPLELDHLLLDANGTLTDRGTLVGGVPERLASLAAQLEVRILSADTFATLADVAAELGVTGERVASGEEKARVAERLGADRCAAVGNGANDAELLAAAALGIAVVGPEGAAGSALRAADVVCGSIVDALDLLLDPRALAATLRA